MSSSGVVSIRFDVQGNEQLLSILKASSTGIKGFNVEMLGLQSTLAKPMGGQGPLQNMAAGIAAAETKVVSFKGHLASIGSQLGANATSFGVATASIWGVYNAYDSLEKVQIRAHASAVKVQTLETSLASLTERRRLAVEKGNLTGEQMAILNEKIANTQDKLSVAQERAADVAQDLQEAWVGFFSTVGPQIVAAGGSIAQLFTTLTTKSPEGVSALTKLKTSFSGLFSSLAGAGTSGLSAIPAMFTKLKTAITGTTTDLGPLANSMKGAGTSTSFFNSTLGAVTIGLGAAAVGAFGIIEAINQVQNTMTAAGLKFKETQFGALDVKSMQIGFDQMDAIMTKLAEHGHKVSAAWIGAFPAEALAEFKQFGGQINAVTGEVEVLAGAVSDLGPGFTSTKADYIEWATTMLQSGKTAGQVFDYLKTSKIKDADSTDIQIAANTEYQASIAALGISTSRYNEIGTMSNDIIKIYADRVRTGQVPVEALTESIHGQVQALVASGAIKEEESKIMEDLIVRHLKLNSVYKQTTASIDKERDARYKANEATIQSFVAYNGVNALQGKSIGQMEVFNETIGKSIEGVVEQGLTLRKWADAEAMATDTTKNFVNTQFDYIDSMINVNKINDGGVQSLILLRQAHTDGLTAAQNFYTSMVTGAIQTETTTKAIADNAKSVGIQADMMAFSASKAQELITTTYNMNRAFSDQAVAAATDVTWLKDKVLIDAQLKQGMIDGASSANAWTIEMIKSTQAAKDNHGQLVALATEMTGLSDISGLTSEQLQTLMQGFQQTHDAAGSLASVMKDQLIPIFEPLKEFLTATNWKDFSSAFKDLDLKKLGIPKDLRESLKDAGKDLLHVNENALEARTGLSALFTVAFTGRGKGIKSGIKELLDDLKEIPAMGDLTPFTNQLEKIMALPKEERAAAFKKMGPAIAEMMKALAPDEMGFVIITPEEIQKINEKLGLIGPSAQDSVPGVNALSTSIGGLGKSLGEFASAQLDVGKSSPLTNMFLSQQIPSGLGKGKEQKTPAITPPAPIVFPPPDLRNILTGVSQAEIMMSEMVKYAAGLTISFPLPDIGNVITAISHAQIAAGDVVTYVAGLTIAFPEPTTDNVITGVSKAQIVAGDLVAYITGLPLVFPGINIVAIANSTSSASKAAATLVGDIAGLTLAFPGVNIVGVANSTSNAKKAAATLVPDIKALKPAFPGVNIVAVVNSTTNAKNAASKLEGHVAGLNLKFPKIDISNINSSVNEAQKKIDSLHGTTVTNHVKTVFDNAGGNILNDARIMSAAAGKLFTTNGEQLFRVGDNPGGRETIAMIPHDKPHEIMDRLMKMFPPITSTLERRSRRPAMQTISGGGISGGQRSGSAVVNVTTEVYLFPGSDMFKKFVKSIMLEEMSRYAAV